MLIGKFFGRVRACFDICFIAIFYVLNSKTQNRYKGEIYKCHSTKCVYVRFICLYCTWYRNACNKRMIIYIKYFF